jgi:hypothetical protein
MDCFVPRNDGRHVSSLRGTKQSIEIKRNKSICVVTGYSLVMLVLFKNLFSWAITDDKTVRSQERKNARA